MGNALSQDDWSVYTGQADLEYMLPNAPATWPRFKAALSNPPATVDGVRELLCSFDDLHPDSQLPHRSCLSFTPLIAELFEGDESKFVGFIAWVCGQALRVTELFPTAKLPLLRTQHTAHVAFSRDQAACLVAHGFLGTLARLWVQSPETEEKLITGQLRIHFIAENCGGVGLERMRGLILYLRAIQEQAFSLQDEILVERVHNEAPPTSEWWAAQTCPLQPVEIHTESMACDGPDAFVDFANKDLMIHEIIPSATQEEVLFSARPDMFPSLLLVERMAVNEAVLFYNAAPLISTTGYNRNFQVTGLNAAHVRTAGPPPSTVLAIDAVMNSGGLEFETKILVRDLNKAFIAFAAFFHRHVTLTDGPVTTSHRALPGPPPPPPSARISTGLWGCGVFGGTPALKFLQQAMAASVCGRSIRFSTYGDAMLAGQLRSLYAVLLAAKVTVGQLYIALRDSPASARQADTIGRHVARVLTGTIPSTLDEIAEGDES